MLAVSQQSASPRKSERHGIPIRVRSWMATKELGSEFWIFFAGALCFDFGFAVFFFLYNLYLMDVGLGERQLGLITGAMTIGSVIGTIPMGLLAKRVPLNRLLLAGFFLAPGVSALRTWINWEPAQIGIALVTGMCFCLWTVSFSPAAAKLTTEGNRPFAFSLLFSAGIGMGVLGGIVGGILPGWLQRTHPSLHPADAKRIVLLLCCLIVAIGVWPISRLKFQAQHETRSDAWRLDPFLRRFLPAVALWSVVIGSFTPFATAYLSRHIKIPLSHIGFIFSASQLAQVAAVLIAPAVFRRFDLVAGIMYTQIATAIALSTLARAHEIPSVVVLYLAFTAFQWMSGPGIYSLLMNRVAEQERSSASAANMFIASLFQAIASAVSGAAFAKFGYPAVLSAIAGVALLAALLFRMLLQGHEYSSVPVTRPAEHQIQEIAMEAAK